MALSATVVGALMGLGTQMYSNALRKLPYMHLGALGGDGAWSGSRQPVRQMGGSAQARPRQVAAEGQASQRAPLFLMEMNNASGIFKQDIPVQSKSVDA